MPVRCIMIPNCEWEIPGFSVRPRVLRGCANAVCVGAIALVRVSGGGFCRRARPAVPPLKKANFFKGKCVYIQVLAFYISKRAPVLRRKEAAVLISVENTLGRISFSANYFAELVSMATQSGFGVAGMTNADASDDFKALIMSDFSERGVRVIEEGGRLVINLHIKVTYGLNISAAVKNITHNVQYLVEEATGLSVKRIDVSVDDVVA